MKQYFLLLILLVSFQSMFAQNLEADSLYQLFQAEKSNSKKVDILSALAYVYENSRPDSSLLLAQQAYFIAKADQYSFGQSRALGQMAAAYKSLGNFTKSLEYYISKLKIDEVRDSVKPLANTYLALASLYDDSKDYDQGLLFAKKADVVIQKNKLDAYAPYSLLDIGDIFEKKNMLDSAMFYTHRCLQIGNRTNDSLIIGTALNNMGNINYKLGNYPGAAGNYRAAFPYETVSGNLTIYVESLLGIAKVFVKTIESDSALWYAKKAYNIATSNQFTVKALEASMFLSGLYKQANKIDSAFSFQEIMIGLKDSIESSEKIRQLQNISSTEQLRQAELEQLKEEQKKDRAEKLQLLLIGIMIPIFFLLSVFISRKKVHKRLIEFTGIVSVLLFFEYITLLLHPFIAEKTDHSPVMEIIIFVAIAAVITPTHHRIQHWLVTRLTEFNYLKHHKQVIDPEQEDA